MNISSLLIILTLSAFLLAPSSSIICYDCPNNRNITCRLDYRAENRSFARYECFSVCNKTVECSFCQSVLTKLGTENFYKTTRQGCQLTVFSPNETCATYRSETLFTNNSYIHQLFTQHYTNTSFLPPLTTRYPYAVCGCNTSYCNGRIVFSFIHDPVPIVHPVSVTGANNGTTFTSPVNTSTTHSPNATSTRSPLLNTSNSTTLSPIPHLHPAYLAFTAAGLLLAVLIASLLICPVISYRCYKRNKFSSYQLADEKTNTSHYEMATLSSPHGFYEDPELARVPILTDLKMEDLIGSGKYGHVWRCLYQGREMACKVWLPCEINAWRSERTIFSQETTYHPNIVRYIHSGFLEERSELGFMRKGVLLMELCPRGSLSNFLETSTLSWEVASRFTFEIASGISYLHSHTGLARAEKGYKQVQKCPIAHRDIKSSNVLIRSNMTCCISDLGLAMALNPSHSADGCANVAQVGTPFYMAPEALNAKINLQDLDSFKQMDVFSMGLVLWEIFSRCEVADGPPVCSEHKIPFSDTLSHSLLQSSRVSRVELIQQLRDLHQRPVEELLPVPTQWKEHPLFSKARRTILDCTYTEPEARITAGTVTGRFELNMVQGNKHNEHEKSFCESMDFGSFASMSSLMRMIESQRLSRINCDNYIQLPEYSV